MAITKHMQFIIMLLVLTNWENLLNFFSTTNTLFIPTINIPYPYLKRKVGGEKIHVEVKGLVCLDH